jgi:hypothetical protein
MLSGESEIPSARQRTVTASPSGANRILVLSNPMGEFGSHQRGCGARETLESQHGRDSSLDGSVVVRDDIVKVLARSDDDSAPCGIPPAKKPKRGACRRISIDSNLPWRLSMVGNQSLSEEGHGGADVPLRAKVEINGATAFIDRGI